MSPSPLILIVAHCVLCPFNVTLLRWNLSWAVGRPKGVLVVLAVATIERDLSVGAAVAETNCEVHWRLILSINPVHNSINHLDSDSTTIIAYFNLVSSCGDQMSQT